MDGIISPHNSFIEVLTPKEPLGILWKEWCWSWNSSTLATSRKELTHWKRLWCWEGLGAGGEGDNRGWDGWMASMTQWTWVWVNSRSWWWTGRPGMLRFMVSQRVGHNWATELTELIAGIFLVNQISLNVLILSLVWYILIHEQKFFGVLNFWEYGGILRLESMRLDN